MASFFHLPCQPASHFSSLLSITLSPFPFLTLSKNAFHAQSFNLTIFQVPVVFSLSPTCYTLPTSLSVSALLHSPSLFFRVLSFLFSFFASGCAALGSSLSPSCSCVDRVQLSVMCYCCAVYEYVCIVQAVMLCQLPTFMLCCSFPLSSHLILFFVYSLCRQTCPLQHFLPSPTAQHIIPYSYSYSLHCSQHSQTIPTYSKRN